MGALLPSLLGGRSVTFGGSSGIDKLAKVLVERQSELHCMTTRAGTSYGMEDLQGNDEGRGEQANENVWLQ